MTQLDQLKQEIEALMSDNEVVKANAIKASTTNGDRDRCANMYGKAKGENATYQNVLELIDKIQKSEK